MDDMMTSLRADRSIQFTPEALADMRRRIEADEPRHRIAADYGTFQGWMVEKKVSEGHSERDALRLPTSEKLAEMLAQFGKPVTVCASVKEGVETAIRLASGENDAVVAFGSLYMVGDIRTAAMEK